MEEMPAEYFRYGKVFRTVFQYLEMSERAGRTQRVGEYCKRGPQWILSNWNSEIPPIIGVAVWISVTSR